MTYRDDPCPVCGYKYFQHGYQEVEKCKNIMRIKEIAWRLTHHE